MTSTENGQQSALPVFALRQLPTDDVLLASCPLTAEILWPKWKDGKCLRQSGSVRVRLVGGYYLITLHCPTEGVEATLTTDTLVDPLGQLEVALRNDTLVWLPDFERQKKTRQVRVD